MLIKFRFGMEGGGWRRVEPELGDSPAKRAQWWWGIRDQVLVTRTLLTLCISIWDEWKRMIMAVMMLMMALINQRGNFGDQSFICIPFERPFTGG